MANPIAKIKRFYGETMHEVKRCSWPTKPELIQNTVLVIIVVGILTAFCYVADLISRKSLMWFLTNIPEWLT